MYKHEFWLWFWFFIGMMMYMLKRSYYLVTGPNPVANSYLQFIQRCWIPLLVRGFLDSIAFWALFTPGMADKALDAVGWPSASWAMSMVTQFAFAAALFGHVVDSVMDFAVSKLPYLKDALPQMPGPLPKPPQAPIDPTLPSVSGGSGADDVVSAVATIDASSHGSADCSHSDAGDCGHGGH